MYMYVCRHAPAKFKRGAHFCNFTGMWIFLPITVHRTPAIENHRPKLGLSFSFVERNYYERAYIINMGTFFSRPLSAYFNLKSINHDG